MFEAGIKELEEVLCAHFAEMADEALEDENKEDLAFLLFVIDTIRLVSEDLRHALSHNSHLEEG